MGREEFSELKRMTPPQFEDYLSTVQDDMRASYRNDHGFEKKLLLISTPVAALAWFIPFGIILTLLYILIAPMLASTLFLSYVSHAKYARNRTRWFKKLRTRVEEASSYEDYVAKLHRPQNS